jgi:hypothetical protein
VVIALGEVCVLAAQESLCLLEKLHCLLQLQKERGLHVAESRVAAAQLGAQIADELVFALHLRLQAGKSSVKTMA